jgi:GH3 auxin-responsive promoter
MAQRKLRCVRSGAIFGPALWGAAKARVAQWDHLALRPERVQQRTLLANCRLASQTAFGRKHDLVGVLSYEDFRERVPLRTYADVAPDIERMLAGERDVLSPGLVPYLAKSAGSTESAIVKMLPVSRTQIRWQQRQAFDILARYLTLSGDIGFTGGFTLGLLQPPTVETRGPVGITTNPRLMQRYVPTVSRLFSLPRPPVQDIEDMDEMLDAVADAYLDYDVRAIAGTTCWFAVLFERVLAKARARGMPSASVHQIWPNLRGLFGGGVSAGSYRAIIDQRVGGRTFLIDTYNATEGGVFAVTDRAGDDAMAVLPDRGVFFEFIPWSEQGSAWAKRIPLWQVETNVDYSVALSTASGLFGYLIGDVVRFTDVFPHRLVFSGRVSSGLSLTQELTTARQIETAVRVASDKHAATVVELAASAEILPEATAVGRYVLFIEFDREPRDLAAFAGDVDAQLAIENYFYGVDRTRNVGILPLAVVPLERGASQRFVQATHRRGLQQKFPRIVRDDDRDLLRSFARAKSEAS